MKGRRREGDEPEDWVACGKRERERERLKTRERKETIKKKIKQLKKIPKSRFVINRKFLM
jgi:hypothetical protein